MMTPKRTLRILFYCLPLVVFLIVPIQTTAQEAQADPLAGLQQKLSESIGASFGGMWDDCNSLVRPPFDTEDKVVQYLDCFFGNLPNFIRGWKSENDSTLSSAEEILNQIIIQQMPAGENTVNDRQRSLGVAVFTYRKLSAWHQRFADMVNPLAAANFLIRSEAQSLLEEVQKSMNDCTAKVRALAAELNKDESMSREDLEKKCTAYLSEVFAHPRNVVDKFQSTMLNALSRTKRHYPTMLERGTAEPRQFAKSYEEFFTKIYTAMEICANDLWTAKPQEQK